MSRVHAAAGFVELGEVRRRVGDLEGAEEAFREAEALCGRPQAGLALLRLAQGRVDAATAIIERALEEETWNRLARAKLLPARVQIAVACDDLASASRRGDRARRHRGRVRSSSAARGGRLGPGSTQPGARATPTRRAPPCGERSSSGRTSTSPTRWRRLDCSSVRPVAVPVTRTAPSRRSPRPRRSSSSWAPSSTSGPRATCNGPRPLPAGLTEREAQVLRLVAAGRSNKDIAATLFLSERTVARHLSNIFAKTGVSSRSAATAYAFEHGLVGTSG